MIKQLVPTSLLASGVIFLGGCMAPNHARDEERYRISIGQQLSDLKGAQVNGAIDEKEFQELKAKLIGTR